ncbi:MAG: HAD family hydrolase [Alkalispirochaeta sp.]
MEESFIIRGVAFDIDGTLYPNRRMYRASLGIVLSHLRLFRAFGAARKDVRTRHPIADLRRETAELTAQRLKISPDEATQRIDEVIYRRWERVLGRVPLYPGVTDLLTELRRRGVPLAAMSDFPVTGKLELLGIETYWDVAFSAEDVGYLKPNVEPFEELEQRMGLRAREILYVGNSYHYDVLGAAAAGFRTAHLGGDARKPGRADMAFRDFSTLHTWILERLPEVQNHPDD